MVHIYYMGPGWFTYTRGPGWFAYTRGSGWFVHMQGLCGLEGYIYSGGLLRNASTKLKLMEMNAETLE